MSWASHNPEKYQEIMHKGMARQFISMSDSDDLETLEEEVLVLLDNLSMTREKDAKKFYDAWQEWASGAITSATGRSI